ncbi:BatA domain-containing protein [Psychroflexus montanilacus]|uniref:BatA domain-containing protein n=1 Tax=Psychroflexus montanilacus TaxID=2873598 RepID=UPI001CCC9032|nr:BatA domain-containing protein [Psychroflexus montanilacus]MBZ9651429.1 BatA domain-containing protein [Psychroflexus montanilacus]
MFFTNPSFLWALLGLGIPVAIHLWSKRQGKNIRVGSIKFLQESNSQRSRSIQLNELWLLLLRMLLIALLVFIIAEPRLTSKIENSPITYLVEASLLESPEVKTLADSLNAQAEVRFLKTDFPEYNSERLEPSNSGPPNYWQLAREMQTFKTDSIVVFTNAFLSGIKGKRPEITTPINWVNLNPDQTKKPLVGVIKDKNEAEWISVKSDTDVFKFQKEIKNMTSEIRDSILVIEKDTLQISMYSEEQFSSESRYLKASFLALEKYLNHPFKIKNIKEKDSLSPSDLLVWLSDQPAPDTEAKVLKFRSDALAGELLESGNSENEYYLTSELTSENVIDEHLGDQLLKMLNLYPELRKEAGAYDRRVMNLELLKPNFTEDTTTDNKDKGREVSNYLWLVLVILLLSERVLSRYRKQ